MYAEQPNRNQKTSPQRRGERGGHPSGRPARRDSAFLTPRTPRRTHKKSFAGRKGFFFAESSRSSRLRGESLSGLSPRRREAREENGRTLVWLRLCCSVFIGGFIHALRSVKFIRRLTISWPQK